MSSLKREERKKEKKKKHERVTAVVVFAVHTNNIRELLEIKENAVASFLRERGSERNTIDNVMSFPCNRRRTKKKKEKKTTREKESKT